MWFLENYRGQGLTLITVRDHNDTILLHGDLNTGSFLFATYQNKLTFLQFVSDFDNTMVICGRGDALNIGHFPLVVFSKLQHILTFEVTHYFQNAWLRFSITVTLIRNRELAMYTLSTEGMQLPYRACTYRLQNVAGY